MNCPGSIQLCQACPKKPGSKWANEGTAAHYLGEWCLARGRAAHSRLGDTLNVKIDGKMQKFEVTEEMADAVQVYLNYAAGLFERFKGAGIWTHIEHRLDLGPWIPDSFGTSDLTMIVPLDTLVVVDYKHGAGVPVDVEGNTQMMIYALGALGQFNPHGVDQVEMTIVQPRAPHTDGPIRTMVMSATELQHWGDYVLRSAARECLNPVAVTRAGSWCRWCDALESCPEVAKSAAETMFGKPQLPVVTETEKPNLPNVATLTPDQMANVYRIANDYLEPWLKAVKAAWHNHLRQNGPAGGFKIVEGRASRSWKDELGAELEVGEILGDGAYEEPKFKSPAQVEKALKKIGRKVDDVSHLIESKRGETIAPLNDKRPAKPSAAETMFEIAPPGEETE
jgi:hypothetical protein